jgi:Crinkler effector protein N-terminal domain
MFDIPVPSQEHNCLIEGESIVFTVPVGRDWNVSNLKEAIQRKRKLDTLKGVGPELWKVSARCEVT